MSAISGYTATVSPSTLRLDPGETESFTVTLTRTTAPFDVYQFGALTLTDGAHNVRVPIAVKAVQLITTGSITGTAASGTFAFNSFAGYTGPYARWCRTAWSSTRARPARCKTTRTTPSTRRRRTSTQPGVSFHDVVITGGDAAVRFALFDDFTDGNDDLDLVIYRQSGTNWLLTGATGGDIERGVQPDQPDGRHLPRVHPRVRDRWTRRQLHVVPLDRAGGGGGNMSVSAPAMVTAGNTYVVTGSWGAPGSAPPGRAPVSRDADAPSPGRASAARVASHRAHQRVHRRAAVGARFESARATRGQSRPSRDYPRGTRSAKPPNPALADVHQRGVPSATGMRKSLSRVDPRPNAPLKRRAREATPASAAFVARRPRARTIHPRGSGGEPGRRAGPAQLVDVPEHGDVGAECREIAEQERALAIARQRCRQAGWIRGVDSPGAPVGRDRLEMAVAREHRRGGLRPQPARPG